MRTTLFILLLVLGASWVGHSAIPAERIVGFAALPDGDKVEVKLLSVDCFSTCRAYELTFSRSTNASVVVYKLEGARGVSGEVKWMQNW